MMKRPVPVIAVFVVLGSALFQGQSERQVSAQTTLAAVCVPNFPTAV